MDGAPEGEQRMQNDGNLHASNGPNSISHLIMASAIVSRDVSTGNSDIDVTNIDDPQVSLADNIHAQHMASSTSAMAAVPPQIRRHSDPMISVERQPVSQSPGQSPLQSRFATSPSLSLSTHSSSPPPIIMSDREFSHSEDGSSYIITGDMDDPRKYEPINIDTTDHGEDATYTLPDSSPEMIAYDNGTKTQYKTYKCRLCNFTATTYTQLQLHMPRHGGVKALKCPLCDYSTNDKSNFRRHRRLHIGNNPVSVLKCEKCTYSTILPRKFREHYSQVHNEQIGPNYQFQTSPYRPSGYDTAQFKYRLGHVDLNPGHIPTSTAPQSMAATTALHSLLRGIHSTPVHYTHQPAQPLQGQCLGQYPSYAAPVRRTVDESHMASNYLRSIVSSIMNNPQTVSMPTPSSTISSSGFYMAADPSQQHQQQQQQQQHQQQQQQHIRVAHSPIQVGMQTLQGHVKVKVEPPDHPDTPETADVSSTAPPPRHQFLSDQERRLELHPFSRSYSEVEDGSMVMECNEVATSAEIRQTLSADSGHSQRGDRASIEVRTTASVDDTVNTTVKMEMSSVGIQCSIPIIKTESSIVSDTPQTLSASCVERGVQCEIMTSGRCLNQRSRSLPGEASFTEQQNFQLTENRCNHCGITFDDEVLFSIHIGCHSHTDPFVCNVCGKHCGNKYGFYSHIMRGHHY
ncbi:protein hunchback-like [Ylistrum balloti]|uniref:protein hunchback-like n=1 Tax=Ylistrum balloti TaxID=509963 RepID=UPI002905F77A|nr:protein hunchback-like [Ylistrum balloti]